MWSDAEVVLQRIPSSDEESIKVGDSGQELAIIRGRCKLNSEERFETVSCESISVPLALLQTLDYKHWMRFFLWFVLAKCCNP